MIWTLAYRPKALGRLVPKSKVVDSSERQPSGELGATGWSGAGRRVILQW
jgi:hypothetical protein